MYFNPRSAKQLQDKNHLLVEGCPGLRLTCNGNRKTWTYRYELQGKMKQKAFGHWPEMSLADAVGIWQTLRDGGVKKQSGYLVSDVIADYVRGHLKNSRSGDSLKAAHGTLAKARPIEQLKASSITRSQAFELLDRYKDIPAAATKLRSLLASAWDYALDAGKLDEDTPNHWRSVMRGRLKSKGKKIDGKNIGKRRRVLSDQEVSALLKWMPAMHQVGQDCIVMYLWTGTRGGEFLSIQPENITLEDGQLWMTVPKAATKNAEHELAVDLRVPLFGKAREVIERRMGKTPMFEGSSGEPYRQRLFSTYIYSLQPYSKRNATLRCPVVDWTPHNLRRTARTILASLGCPNEIGEAIVGHIPPEMVATYNSYQYDSERKHWLRLLSDHLARLGSLPVAEDPQPA